MTGKINETQHDSISSSTTNIKSGWYTDNYETYFLDENLVKHYDKNSLRYDRAI